MALESANGLLKIPKSLLSSDFSPFSSTTWGIFNSPCIDLSSQIETSLKISLI